MSQQFYLPVSIKTDNKQLLLDIASLPYVIINNQDPILTLHQDNGKWLLMWNDKFCSFPINDEMLLFQEIKKIARCYYLTHIHSSSKSKGEALLLNQYGIPYKNRIKEGSLVDFKITNTSNDTIYFTLVDLKEDFSVEFLIDNYLLRPNESLTISEYFSISIPSLHINKQYLKNRELFKQGSYFEPQETLKAILTSLPVDSDFLEDNEQLKKVEWSENTISWVFEE
jgi:hypothetical protein